MSRLSGLKSLSLFVSLTLLHPQMVVGSSGPLACDFSNEKSPMVSIQITNPSMEGAELRFPKGYASSDSFKSGELREELFLTADAKDFSSYPKSKFYLEDGTSKSSLGIVDWVLISIGSRHSMPLILNNLLAHKYEEFEHMNPGNKPINSLEGDFELMVPLGYTKRNLERYFIYFGESNGSVSDVIFCFKKGVSKSIDCNHLFEVGAYDVKIFYSRSELPRWRELRENTAKLLQCFTIKEPKQRP